jgi:hypothetical protein
MDAFRFVPFAGNKSVFFVTQKSYRDVPVLSTLKGIAEMLNPQRSFQYHDKLLPL